MTLDDKVDMIYTGICEMRPILMATAESVRTMDLRQRFLETRVEQHDVKLERAIADIDGIGKKVRISDDQSKISNNSDDTKWIAVLKFLAILPHYSKGIWTFALFVISILCALFAFFGINIKPEKP